MILDWFKSYLCERYQCIKIGSFLSNNRLLFDGLPRAFILYVLLSNHPGIRFSFYADDTQLYVYFTHKHVTEAFGRLKNCLDDVKK